MAVEIKDGAAAQKYLKSTGAGTIGDGFIVEHLDTNSAAIKTAVELIDNAIAGSEMQVDVITMPTVTISDGGSSITVDGTLSLAALPAGTNNIGDVDVLTLPALPAGTNNIGDVDILTIAAGDNNIGNVDVVTLPVLPAGTNNIGDVDIASIAAGDNNIGNVDIVSLPALPAGTNNIGDIDVLTLPGTAAEAAALPAVFHVVAGDDGTDTHPLQLDASGFLKVNVSAGAAAGTEYTEGDTDATITGTAMLWEDTSDTLRSVSAAKPLPVNIISGAGSGGTAAADDADFTAGTTSGTPAMGVYESTPTSVTDGDLGTVGITTGRRLKTSATIDAALPAGTNNIGDVDVLTLPALAAGTNNIGDVDIASIAAGDNNIGNVDVVTLPALAAGTNNIGDVDVLTLPALPAGTNNIGDVDVLSIVPGTAATNQGKAEDAVHASGDTGIFALSVRKDTAASTAGTDGDYAGLITDANGRLHVLDQNSAAIMTAVQLIDNAISGSEMQVDVVAALPAGTNNIGDVDVLTLPALAAGTAHIGSVGASDTLIEVTPTLDTGAHTAGDVLISETELANAGRASGTTIVLQSIMLVDKDDQKAAITLYFFDRTVTFGTKNAAPSISDADAAFYMGHVDILAADWKDLGGVAVATVRGIGLEMKPNATSIYIAATTGGTPTHTASGIVAKFSFLRS